MIINVSPLSCWYYLHCLTVVSVSIVYIYNVFIYSSKIFSTACKINKATSRYEERVNDSPSNEDIMMDTSLVERWSEQ